MFQSYVLKGALCALALLEASVDAAINPDDILKYQEFADAMATSGLGYEWQAYDVYTPTGYEIKLFRITADATGTPLEAPKGPALLIHGMFSEPTSFFNRTDTLTAGLPVQLAQQGYDVWVGCTRGRDYTLGSDATMVDPLTFDYWNFDFENVGREDIVTMVDTIISSRNRPTEGCSKVTVVTHSTGANQVLVAASDPGNSLATKVEKIVTIAPCLNIHIEDFWLNVKDLASIAAFYMLLDQFNIDNLFGPTVLTDIEPFCNPPDMGITKAVCEAYLLPALQNDLYMQTSLKDFEHVHTNTAMNTFGQFPPMGTVDSTPFLYQIDAITGIPVHAILSEADQACPSSANTARMAPIPTLTSETLPFEGGFDHLGMLNNDATYMASLIAHMPALASTVSDPFVCPVIIPDNTCFLEEYVKEKSKKSKSKSSKSKSKEKSCKSSKYDCDEDGRRRLSHSKSKSKSKKSGSYKEPKVALRFVGECTQADTQRLMAEYNTAKRMVEVEARLNKKLDKNILQIERWQEYQKGNPEHIMAKLMKTCGRMDDFGFSHMALAEIPGYLELVEACGGRRRLRQLAKTMLGDEKTDI